LDDGSIGRYIAWMRICEDMYGIYGLEFPCSNVQKQFTMTSTIDFKYDLRSHMAKRSDITIQRSKKKTKKIFDRPMRDSN